MMLHAGQAYRLERRSGLYRVVARLEVVRGNWRLLEDWCLKLPDNQPEMETVDKKQIYEMAQRLNECWVHRPSATDMDHAKKTVSLT